MKWDERTHEGQTEKGTSSRGSRAKQSQGRLSEVQGCSSLEAQRSRTQDAGSMPQESGHTHTHRHTATLGSLHNVNEVVCAQRLFPSCIWEVNTRVWAQSPGQPLQLAKELPCVLEFGIYCSVCVLKTQNQKGKEKKTKQKDRGQKWTANPEIQEIQSTCCVFRRGRGPVAFQESLH